MNRTKKSKRSSSADAPQPASSAGRDAVDPRSEFDRSGLPPVAVRNALSIWLPIHLFTLFISYSAVVEPSSLHARIQSLLRPYLQVTHFGADDRPLYLAFGEPSEQPHRLEITESDIADIAADVEWTNPHFVDGAATRLSIGGVRGAVPGSASSDRYHRWLATAATLAENDQHSLVAELLAPALEAIPEARAVRIVRIPTDLNSTIEDQASPYVARVIRDAKNRVTLVRLHENRLSASASEANR